ncbi:response regulator receiver protein [Syntrophobotulus glycolicus DSM 8271]|uniref:Stage 0 sporulation protein A homolog n=1 Tax=Syntrophobotulus glycolicus (strain DSM 8271 / FlGlyR) TaxID=645991 RepID=F0T2E1_SYNGF|nr:response regulator [Syntrophobotulus glycolicus]ADY57569.1 response regulator receiver protein [Syntrophobotulus glycolicus DSM 8271]
MSRILIVDDNDGIINILKVFLTANGHEVMSAPNALAAISRLHHNPIPDFILTDYSMPLMNGCEFVGKVFEDQRYRHIPIVIMTGSIVDLIEFPKSENFCCLIKKPFILEKILNIINRHLYHSAG